jgi:hypothetical protein
MYLIKEQYPKYIRSMHIQFNSKKVVLTVRKQLGLWLSGRVLALGCIPSNTHMCTQDLFKYFPTKT